MNTVVFGIACQAGCWFLVATFGTVTVRPTVVFPMQVHCELSAMDFRLRTMLRMKLDHTERPFVVGCSQHVPPPYVPR